MDKNRKITFRRISSEGRVAKKQKFNIRFGRRARPSKIKEKSNKMSYNRLKKIFIICCDLSQLGIL